MKKRILFAIFAIAAVGMSSCGGHGSSLESAPSSSSEVFPAPDGSDLVGAFAEVAWNAAAPHFAGLESFAGDAFRDEEYPFPANPAVAEGFTGYSVDPARYPEGEPCPELDDIVIHGGIHQKIKVSPEAPFAPSMGFIGHEVDCLMLVVTGMYGSTWYMNMYGELYKTDYAILFLMSDGSSLFAGLEWDSGYVTSLYKYDGHPMNYLFNKTRLYYTASMIQSAVGRVPNFALHDFGVSFSLNEERTAIDGAFFKANWPEEVGNGGTRFGEGEIEIVGGLSEEIFEESIDVESLREEYGPEDEKAERLEASSDGLEAGL